MELAIIDWIIIGAFMALSLFIGIWYSKKGSTNLSSFFLGGRNLPWYIAGISMVATTFAADTPLAVTEMVAESGISGNWLWWSFLIGGLLTTFFFARLWRRAEILTEPELIEFRYSGREAGFLRGFKAVYLGVFMNCMVISWVNLAMAALLTEFFGISQDVVYFYIFGLMAIAVLYSSLSGLLGVAITDTVQFFIAMIGVIILAFLVVNSDDVGGIDNLKAALPQNYFDFFPSISNDIVATGAATPSVFSTLSLSIGAFLSFVAVQWWASWYPGGEPGGGGYIAQRMMSTRTEKDSVFATLFFNIGHYCLRPWPWIVVALCAVMLYSPKQVIEDEVLMEQMYALKAGDQNLETLYAKVPGLEARAENNTVLLNALPGGIGDTTLIFAALPVLRKMAKENDQVRKSVQFLVSPKLGYVFAMKDYLPTGLKGLLLVAFLAAYLSTISTQVNWGASYLVNDLHKRFFVRESLFKSTKAADKHYIRASRLYSVAIMLFSMAVLPFVHSISGVWSFIMECGAGLGLVLILRWYWWRINAWSEIAATIAPFIGYYLGHYQLEPYLLAEFPTVGDAMGWGDWFVFHRCGFMLTVLFTTVVWLVVTYATRPTAEHTLLAFYDKVKPDGSWRPIAALSTGKRERSQTPALMACWISSILMVYSLLFAIGKVIFKEWNEAFLCIGIAVISFMVLRLAMKRTNIFGD